MRWKIQECSNHERKKKLCGYHQTNGHSDKEYCQQMEKSKKIKMEHKKWCSLHNSTSHSYQDCFQQKSGSKCKDSSTVTDGKNIGTHEIYVDSTTVDCKSCCCNGKIAKKSSEKTKVKYSLPPRVSLSFACFHLPLPHQADGFQMLMDSGSS